ncbi:eCIS core domain-containing protein [Streptomyces sp. NPDC004778]
MRAQGKDRTGQSGDGPERAVIGTPTKESATARQGTAPSGAEPLLALQATVGNAVAVQMLRRAPVQQREQSQDQERQQGQGQERHRHGAGCGHEQDRRPAVQRSAVHDVLRTSGRPLEDSVRTDMESRLGADFSDVRVHDDSAAKASAAEVGARAYTSGSHVVIGDGGGDRHTLAHELTHVIQQRQGQVAGTDNGGGLRVSDPSDRFERAAEANARRVMAAPARTDVQRAPAPSGRPAPEAVVQRVGDPQDMLGASHWKGEMETAGHPLLPPKQKGKKKKAKAPVRKLEDILASVGPGLLAELKALAEKGETGRLKLYRTMMAEEANAIMEWKGLAALTEEWITSQEDTAGISKRFRGAVAEGEAGIMPISNHLGDAGQADEYFTNEDAQVTVEFTLKPGAHELLFSPDYMAISGDKGTPYHIRKTRETADKPFPEAAAGEGALAGYIGLKPEEKEPFSLSIGKTDITRLLFQLFVEDMRAVRGEKNLTSGTA